MCFIHKASGKLLAFFYIYFMKSFSEFQGRIPTYQVICEANTQSDCKIRFEFKIEALNEKSANEISDEIVSQLNLKDVTKNLRKI